MRTDLSIDQEIERLYEKWGEDNLIQKLKYESKKAMYGVRMASNDQRLKKVIDDITKVFIDYYEKEYDQKHSENNGKQ